MLFDKVTKEQVLNATEIFKAKGFPPGLGASQFYYVIINGEEFPPKPIMAYANELADGTPPSNYFHTGKNEPCFKAFIRLEFEIVEKKGSLIEKYLKEFAGVADDRFKDQDWLTDRYKFYKFFYKLENLDNANWEYFQKLGDNIHSFQSMAIAKSNALGKLNMPIEDYRKVFKYIISEVDPINITVNNLYKRYGGTHYLPYFSDSSISELIGYAFPEKYVLYNRRDLAALEILGITLPKVRSEKFGDKFLRYNETIKPIIESYKEIVGARTDTTINLELDQFFFWLYETKKDNKPITELLESYKSLVRKNGLSEEKYKWQFIRDYKGKPDLSADIEEEVRKIKFPNIIYHLSAGTLKVMASEKGEELNRVFSSIQDENVDLDHRVADFIKDINKVYKATSGKNTSQQDERSLSVYLTLYSPEEYTFYKNSYYESYCNHLGVKAHRAKKKFSHYMEMIHDLAENYLSKDVELLNIAQAELGDLTNEDPNLLLLAQDMLYQTARARDGVKYWVFQGNPKIYDFTEAIESNAVHDWSVSAHKDKIEIGDKIILWITGPKAGCYALAEVTSGMKNRQVNEDDDFWKKEDKINQLVEINITHNLAKNPILKEEIAQIPSLKDLKVGSQGTNFSATKEEYEVILELLDANSESAFDNVVKLFQREKYDAYIESLKKIVAFSSLTRDDERVAFSVVDKKRLVFIIGSRYSFMIEQKKKRTLFGFVSQKRCSEVWSEYTDNTGKNRAAYWNEIKEIVEFEEEIIKGCVFELNRDYKSPQRKRSNNDFVEVIFGKQAVNNEVKESQEPYGMKSIAPLNQILYGPPGTGKTYNTINYALSIIERKSIESIQNEDRAAVLKRYKEYESKGKIVFTTFHQSMSYEDFIEGIKPVLKEAESQANDESQLQYEIRDGILKNVVQKILDDEKLSKSKEQNLYIPGKHFKLPINKISLGNSQLTEDKAIYDYCIENNCIANGFGEDIDFTGVKTKKDIRERFKKGGIESITGNDFNVSAMERLIFWMDTDQLVFVSNGNSTLRSIGVVTGDYYFDDTSPIKFSQFRPVKWLHKEVDIPIKEIYPKSFSQQSIYQMDQNQVKAEIFSEQGLTGKLHSNYVLIIDEINRGNISSIFGELITLVESDKRKGENEGLASILPYSQTKFSIPNNLFILGTMNTADRSVEALDTALRRRFSFIEMMPDCNLLKGKIICGHDLGELLQLINGRIEMLIDRDHQIGHSYFIGIDSATKLKDAFKDKVIPLLQEYFYGDYGRIGLVLGDGFVRKRKKDSIKFANLKGFDDPQGLLHTSFELQPFDADTDFENALGVLMGNPTQEV